MRVAACLAVTVAIAVLPSAVFADTGLLDRSVRVEGHNHPYKVYVPAQWTHRQKWPVIMFLHGNGRQGLDGSFHLAGGSAASALAAILADKNGFPAVVIFPQAAPDSSWAVPAMLDMVSRQLDATIKEFDGDVDRIYLWGHSMGGSGALRLASHWPDRFAALAESSGNVEPPRGASQAIKDAERTVIPYLSAPNRFTALAGIIRHLPIWVFHSDADMTVPVEQSRQLVAALRAATADVHYTEYSGLMHSDTGAKMPTEKELIPWILSQRRKKQTN